MADITKDMITIPTNGYLCYASGSVGNVTPGLHSADTSKV